MENLELLSNPLRCLVAAVPSPPARLLIILSFQSSNPSGWVIVFLIHSKETRGGFGCKESQAKLTKPRKGCWLVASQPQMLQSQLADQTKALENSDKGQVWGGEEQPNLLRQGKPHLPHPEAEGPLPGVLLLQVQVGVEEDQVDVALQVLQAPQMQHLRLLLILPRPPLEGAGERLKWYPPRESIPKAPQSSPTAPLSTPPEKLGGEGPTLGTKISATFQPTAQALVNLWFPGYKNFPYPVQSSKIDRRSLNAHGVCAQEPAANHA